MIAFRMLIWTFATALAVFAPEVECALLVFISTAAFGYLMLFGGIGVLVWLVLDWRFNDRKERIREKELARQRRNRNRIRPRPSARVCATPPLPRQRTREGVR